MVYNQLLSGVTVSKLFFLLMNKFISSKFFTKLTLDGIFFSLQIISICTNLGIALSKSARFSHFTAIRFILKLIT